MSVGDHKFVKMKEQDTVVLSSTPIPETGNDAAVGNMVDDLCVTMFTSLGTKLVSLMGLVHCTFLAMPVSKNMVI
jgi:mRNA degradation ribonuclease J1/J2